MALKRKIACIDLDSKQIDIKPIPMAWRHKFLGGRGLNAYLLYKHLPLGCDPLGSDNVVIIGSGLLGGTLTAPVECTDVVTKSPLTQLLGRARSSGFFASEKGRARRPIYLFVHNGRIQIRNAEKVWGRGVFESRDFIRNELADANVRIIGIGPAGENLVRYANITADRNQVSGRTGMGAVLGSKNIKAIVCRGEMDIQIKHPVRALQNQKKFMDLVLAARDRHPYTQITGNTDLTLGDILLAESGGRGAAVFSSGNQLVTDLGLDPLAAESMLRWAIALYENKIIDGKDTGGLKLRRNNPEAAQELIKQMVLRQGLGDVLAQGPMRAAEKIGAGSLAYLTPVTRFIKMHTGDAFDSISHTLKPASFHGSKPVKQSLAPHPERFGEKGTTRFAETSTRAASTVEKRPKDYMGAVGKVSWQELNEMVFNCLGLCAVQAPSCGNDTADYSVFRELIRFNTGLTLNEKALREIAYRCYAIERLFNLRESAACRQQQQPGYVFDLPLDVCMPASVWDGIDLKQLKRMVNEHYRLRGWNKTAILKLKVFKRLGINDLWPLAKQKGD
jgi:aldehyde:ferredoxin oxidoreductase